MGNFEPAKFIPFHFVKFALLTSLVKDKIRSGLINYLFQITDGIAIAVSFDCPR